MNSSIAIDFECLTHCCEFLLFKYIFQRRFTNYSHVNRSINRNATYHAPYPLQFNESPFPPPLHFCSKTIKFQLNSSLPRVNQSLVLTSLSRSFVQMLLGKNTPIPISNFLSTKSTLNLGGNSHSPLLLKFYTMLPQYRQPSQHTVRFEFVCIYIRCCTHYPWAFDMKHCIVMLPQSARNSVIVGVVGKLAYTTHLILFTLLS